jgi:ribosomal protein S18 acetylase RimI-like enzyme
MACEDDGRPVGVGRGHFNNPTEGQVRYLAVDPAYQGKGIGGQVLAELEKRLHAKGATTIVLNARETAVKFYTKHGYTVTGAAPTLFDIIPHSRMQKTLGD